MSIVYAYLNVMTTLGICEDNDMITATAVKARYGPSFLQLLSQYPVSALEPSPMQVQFANTGFCKQQKQSLIYQIVGNLKGKKFTLLKHLVHINACIVR